MKSVIRQLSVATGVAGMMTCAMVFTPVAHAEKEPAATSKVDSSNWPCAQRKVGKLTSAQLWDGPPVEDIRNWWEDKEVTKLVRYLISRRISMEEAEEQVTKFAESMPEGAERDKRLTLLFAGILQETNTTRSSIVTGIERFQERQFARAKTLQKESSALTALRKRLRAGEKVEEKIEKAQQEYDWNARVFKERQDNIPLACEIPVEIEQRAFGLGRAIRFHMS